MHSVDICVPLSKMRWVTLSVSYFEMVYWEPSKGQHLFWALCIMLGLVPGHRHTYAMSSWLNNRYLFMNYITSVQLLLHQSILSVWYCSRGSRCNLFYLMNMTWYVFAAEYVSCKNNCLTPYNWCSKLIQNIYFKSKFIVSWCYMCNQNNLLSFLVISAIILFYSAVIWWLLLYPVPEARADVSRLCGNGDQI